MQYIHFAKSQSWLGFPASVNTQQLMSCRQINKELSIVKRMFGPIGQLPGNSGRKNYTSRVSLLQAKLHNVLCGGP
jgi:hypothetical protein